VEKRSKSGPFEKLHGNGNTPWKARQMKHIAGILAHKDPQSVDVLCELLRNMGIGYFIHWDKDRESELSEWPALKSSSVEAIKVKRGHISLVMASLKLMKKANEENADFFHLISGQDLPVKPRKEFDEFFSVHASKSFMNHNALPIKESDQDRDPLFNRWTEFRDRVPVHHYNTHFLKGGQGIIDTRHFPPGSPSYKLIQKPLKYRTFQKLYHLLFGKKALAYQGFAGSAWFSINRELLRYFVNEVEEEEYLRYRHAFFPDECAFQSIALNSPCRDKIVNSDLRYIRWERGAHFPSELDGKDLSHIKQSSAFFARKWNNCSP
jgi:hypothetical protein